MYRLILAGLLFVLFVTAPAIAKPPSAAQASANWKIVDLGTLGGDDTLAQAVNNKGWVVGYSENSDGRSRAFLWRNGIMEELGLRGFESWAWDINDKGKVVGTLRLPLPDGSDTFTVGFTWHDGSVGIFALGGLEAAVYGINDRGDFVGSGCPACAFRFLDKGFARILSVGGFDEFDRDARDINRKGQVVGTTYFEESTGGLTHPYVWHRRSGFIDLDVRGFGTAINDRGHIVGKLHGGTAFLWTGDEVIELHTLYGESGAANDINNLGQVVGHSLDRFSKPQRALLWGANGTVTDLGTLGGGCCASATGINDKGQIAGWSTTSGSKSPDVDIHAVLWTK